MLSADCDIVLAPMIVELMPGQAIAQARATWAWDAHILRRRISVHRASPVPISELAGAERVGSAHSATV
jgi:hypothetical protein